MCHSNATQLDIICDLCLERGPMSEQSSHHQLHCMGDMACPLCSARLIGDFTNHMIQFHHAKKDGSVPAVLGWCPRSGCDSSFTSWRDYVQHSMHYHDASVANPALACYLCLLQLKNPDEARKHKEEHFRPKTLHFKCCKCPARFFKMKRLLTHMKKFHKYVQSW